MRFFVGTALAFATLASASPVTSPLIRQSEPAFGCAAGPATAQKVIFNSGIHRYDMFVPFDSTPHTIGGVDTPELSCVDESVSGGLCTSCDVKVDHVQIMNPGVCEVTIKDDQGIVRTFTTGGASERLFFGTAGHPGRITCWPARIPALARHEIDVHSLCPKTEGSNVTFEVGSFRPHKYLLTVAADKQTYNIQTPGEGLRCIGPLGNKYPMCLPCNQDVRSIQVSEPAHTCAFNISGNSAILHFKNTPAPVQLDKPGKVISVICGLRYGNTFSSRSVPKNHDNKHIARMEPIIHSTQDETKYTACDGSMATNITHSSNRLDRTIKRVAAEISLSWALNQARDTDLTDTACSSASYEVAVTGANGDVYFPPVSLDMRTQWMKDMFCVRLTDPACVPCHHIGAAQGVATKVQFGSCVVFMQDQQEFHIPRLVPSQNNTNIIPPTAISPAGIISGIKCGSK